MENGEPQRWERDGDGKPVGVPSATLRRTSDKGHTKYNNADSETMKMMNRSK
jgi:hypothetical protein